MHAYVWRIALNTVVVTAFTALSVWANAKASRYQAAARALGLTTHGGDIASPDWHDG